MSAFPDLSDRLSPSSPVDTWSKSIIEQVGNLSRNTEILSDLMDEFDLLEAKLKGPDWSIELSYRAETVKAAPVAVAIDQAVADDDAVSAPIPAAPIGTPITSPMTGIFYESASPGNPPFVKEGDDLRAGQVIGLIEAMKVFEEITSNVSGKVIEIKVKNGDLVQTGQTLMLVE